mmetsp:Transcript_4224/g.11692  ORF Transcript_4224/g.11692 Transcript_4224/m.11692 type:complete len:81 (+) Transcript_4224:479-721(+)
MQTSNIPRNARLSNTKRTPYSANFRTTFQCAATSHYLVAIRRGHSGKIYQSNGHSLPIFREISQVTDILARLAFCEFASS